MAEADKEQRQGQILTHPTHQDPHTPQKLGLISVHRRWLWVIIE